MSLLSRLLGSSDPAAYTGRESATARKARLTQAAAVKARRDSVARHRRLGAREQRRAADRGWW